MRVTISPSDFLKPPLAVVCHDAGAANLIIGWLANLTGLTLRAHMQGPALKLWQTAFPKSTLFSLQEAIQGSVQLLSGTGWASDLEYEAMTVAQKIGLPTVAAVDHWVNYNQRFVRKGLEVLPNEIWISDDEAFAEAQKCFPGVIIRQFPNMYLQAQVAEVLAYDKNRPPSTGWRVLYALEPIRQHWSGGYSMLGEFQSLDYFLLKLNALGLDTRAQIRLRPHPSDPPGKYESWVQQKRSQYDISLALDEPIAKAVSWADWVVGCESFVLIIAINAGKKTVSTLPPWGHICRLPQKNLIHLSQLE